MCSWASFSTVGTHIVRESEIQTSLLRRSWTQSTVKNRNRRYSWIRSACITLSDFCSSFFNAFRSFLPPLLFPLFKFTLVISSSTHWLSILSRHLLFLLQPQPVIIEARLEGIRTNSFESFSLRIHEYYMIKYLLYFNYFWWCVAIWTSFYIVCFTS